MDTLVCEPYVLLTLLLLLLLLLLLTTPNPSPDDDGVLNGKLLRFVFDTLLAGVGGGGGFTLGGFGGATVGRPDI